MIATHDLRPRQVINSLSPLSNRLSFAFLTTPDWTLTVIKNRPTGQNHYHEQRSQIENPPRPTRLHLFDSIFISLSFRMVDLRDAPTTTPTTRGTTILYQPQCLWPFSTRFLCRTALPITTSVATTSDERFEKRCNHCNLCRLWIAAISLQCRLTVPNNNNNQKISLKKWDGELERVAEKVRKPCGHSLSRNG